MKKGELIESVILKVNGGRLVSDTKVRREDVEVLLASAINYAILQQYYINKKESGDNSISDSFVSTYENQVVKFNTDRDLKYLDLPARLLSLPYGLDLQSISPMKGDSIFIQINLNDRHHNSYYVNTFAGTTLYWMEGARVYFQNLPDITDKVLVRLVESINDLDDDDEVPMPSGAEMMVLKLMDEWLSGQKAMPADMKPDNNNNLQQNAA